MSINITKEFGPSSGMTFTVSTISSHSLSDSDDQISFFFSVPKSGTITKLGFYIPSYIGTPPAYNLGLVNLDSSGSADSTSPYGGSSIHSYTPDSAGWKWVTLDDPADSATVGDIVAIHIYSGATPPDVNNRITISYTPFGSTGIPRYQRYSTSLIRGNGIPPFGIEYDDGSIYGMPTITTSAIDINNGTTPDEVGMKFLAPMDINCMGCTFSVLELGTDPSFDIVLYDSTSTALRTLTISNINYINGGLGAVSNRIYFYWNPITLDKDSLYRLVAKPTSSESIRLVSWEFESSNSRANNGILDTANWVLTQRTDGGSWTDTDTKISAVAIIGNSLDIPGTGGGGIGGAYAYVG